jgi:hypothetical protein
VDQWGLFYWTRFNPDGRWDWYVIGGRWDGYIHGQQTNHDPFDENLALHNVVTTEELLATKLTDRLPHGVVTPTGQWIACSEVIHNSHGFYFREVKTDTWQRQVRRVLKAFPRHRVVCVDVHS